MSEAQAYKDAVETFLRRPVGIEGTRPLKEGATIELRIDANPSLFLKKEKGEVRVLTESPSRDLSFQIPVAAFDAVMKETSEDVAQMGITLLKLLIPGLTDHPIRARLHIGLFEFVARGYLGVLLQGGPGVMKFLAAQGLNGMGSIRDAISRMRE